MYSHSAAILLHIFSHLLENVQSGGVVRRIGSLIEINMIMDIPDAAEREHP